MSDRFAILCEPCESGTRPAGVVLEREGFVMVETRGDFGLPARYDKPFEVAGPDMSLVRHKPDDEQYFEYVLLDLSRTFAIGRRGLVSSCRRNAILDLLRDEVFGPLRQQHFATYNQHHRSFPAVSERQRSYAHKPHPVGTVGGECVIGNVAAQRSRVAA